MAQPPPQPALELSGLTKQFGAVTAVHALDLAVPAGSFFALLGPSGCGKTTTLRMIAGLEQPSAGTIKLDGDDVTAARAFRRPVNTVFQSYALFPHLDVAENVAFGLRRRRQRDIATSVREALELVHMAEFARRRPDQLSGGQQQRVALARAIVNRPKVLLLDEPLGALDLKLRRQMQLELKRIQTEVGLTFIHVTHDQEEAMTMADTVAVMNHGRIEQLGSPVELYEFPSTAFVAGFLGQSNLINAKRSHSSAGAEVWVDCHGQSVMVPAPRVRTSAEVLLVGVRPEKLHLLSDGADPPEGANRLAGGQIADVSFAGVSTQYTVRMPWEQDLTAFAQNLSLERFEVGDSVTLAWAPEHTFGLPAKAGGGS